MNAYRYRYSSEIRCHDDALISFYWQKTSFIDDPITFESVIKQNNQQ